jgi:hypothetical protein
MARFHGFSNRNGDQVPFGVTAPAGKFGRMFPALRPFMPSEASLTELGEAMSDQDDNSVSGDNRKVSAGYTYFGQFVDHDITLDTTTLQEVRVDPLAITNFRTPMLELDSLYGIGPSVQPYLYQLAGGFAPQELFAIGNTNANPGGGDVSIKTELPNDLPRAASGLAIIGDPRNDENLIVAQLHLAFLKFHNKVVAGLKDGSIERRSPLRKSIFEEAREIVIWHYQWIVLHDFLRRILDSKQLDSVLEAGRRFYQFEKDPFIPVEFSVAAYRLGHSMVRSVYDYNRVFTPLPGGVTPATLKLLFDFTGKSGSPNDPFPVPIPSDWIIDWRRFFELDAQIKVNPSRKLDPFLVEPLKNLPNVPPPSSLAVRNLLRGRSLGLPTGQSVARQMRLKPLTPEQIAKGKDGSVAKKRGFDRETPLWYYILKEAQVQGQGLHLGQVGSRIVAEVFVGLLEGDSNSFLSRNPDWKPTLPAAVPGTFTLTDLLRFVDDLSPIDDPANHS